MIRSTLLLLISCLSLLGFSHGINAMQMDGKETCQMASLKCAKAPSATFGPDGKLWLAWVFAGHVYVQHSTDHGKVFSPPLIVNRVPEKIYAGTENRAKIQLDKAGNIYLSWTQPLSKPYTGNIRFSHSVDGGETFSQPVTVNDDRQEISHRFDAMVVNDKGDVFISWLDKRDAQAAMDNKKDYLGGALYYSYSENKGQSFSKNINLSDHSCVCCRIAMALDNNQLPVIAWRDIYGSDAKSQLRDHSLLTFVSAEKPADKIRLSYEKWNINGCPHHGPALDVSSNGTIHAVWFNDAAGEDQYGDENNEEDSDHVLFYGNSATDYKAMGFGRADKQSAHPYVQALGQLVFLVWKEFDGKKTDILMKRSQDSGKNWAKEKVLSTTISTTKGASDHPLLIKNANGVYLSWHTEDEGYRFILLPAGDA